MANYKLSQAAENDLIRIYQSGIETHGEAKADQYFFAFIKRFEQIAIDPYIYIPPLMTSGMAIGAAFAALITSIIVLLLAVLKSCAY